MYSTASTFSIERNEGINYMRREIQDGDTMVFLCPESCAKRLGFGGATKLAALGWVGAGWLVGVSCMPRDDLQGSRSKPSFT